MNFNIIPITKKEEWNLVLSKSISYDFYHCNFYHQLDSSGIPFLFVAEHDNDHIAIPLVKRPIENTPYFDCTSVYGYVGPISNKLPEELNTFLISFFQEQLYKYLQKQNIVSVFSRLHPIINQSQLLANFGEIQVLNKTICINGKISPEMQWQQYRKSNKYEINQLRKKGYSIKSAETDKEVKEFIKIYIDTMQRVNAASMYYFSEEYFYNFLKAEDFKAILLLAYKDSDVVAGAIFTITNNIIQYHLAGTKTEFIKEAPMKLIIDEARSLTSRIEIEYLHLGGGVGGQDDDPLFKFKSGFSHLSFTFAVWKKIIMTDIYNKLAQELANYKELNMKYFPIYRS